MGEDANDTALIDKTNGPIYEVSWVRAVQHRCDTFFVVSQNISGFANINIGGVNVL